MYLFRKESVWKYCLLFVVCICHFLLWSSVQAENLKVSTCIKVSNLLSLHSENYKAYSNLFRAIERGDYQSVQKALQGEAKLDPNVVFYHGLWRYSPLTYAAHHNKLSIIKLLINRGACPDGCVEQEESAPLIEAIFFPEKDAFDTILESGADVNIMFNNHYRKSLYQSEVYGMGINPFQSFLTVHCRHNKSCKQKRLESLQTLIKKYGLDMNEGRLLIDVMSENCECCIEFSMAVALLLISYGVTLNYASPEGGNFLHWMVNNLDKDVHDVFWGLISSYIKAGAEDGLAFALQKPDLKQSVIALREMIISGEGGSKKGVWRYLSHLGTKSLHQLYRDSAIECLPHRRFDRDSANESLQDLLDQIARRRDMNAKAPFGKSYGEEAINVNQIDHAGNAPLFYAVRKKNQIAINSLIGLGADVTQAGEDGETLLHVAARNLDYQMVDTLIEEGTDPRIKNANGDSAVDVVGTQLDLPFRELEQTMAAFCDYQPTLETQSGSINCYDFLTEYSVKYKQCQSDYFSLSNGGCLEIMSRDEITTLIKSWIKSKNTAVNDVLPRILPKLKQSYILGLIDQAVVYSNREVLEQLLMNKTTDDLCSGDARKVCTHLPLKTTDPDITDTLLKWGEGVISPDVNYFIFPDYSTVASEQSMTALVKALLQGKQETASILFHHGAALGQQGLVGAAIRSHRPEMLNYIMERGYRGAVISTSRCSKKAEILCEHGLYNNLSNIDPDMALVFQLYSGPSLVFLGRTTVEKKLDLSLKKAVKNLDTQSVMKYLAAGANPHAVYDGDEELRKVYEPNWTGWYFPESVLNQGGILRPGLPTGSSGLLDSVLRKEQNHTVAKISRILLLFGASIKRRYTAAETFKQARSDDSWNKHLKDEKLAQALDYFERVRRYPMTEEALGKELKDQNSDASQVFAFLQEVASEFGLSMSYFSSPVYNCMGLHSSSPTFDPRWPEPARPASFQPYCQKIQSRLNKSLKMPQ